jgi:hypothetical protein
MEQIVDDSADAELGGDDIVKRPRAQAESETRAVDALLFRIQLVLQGIARAGVFLDGNGLFQDAESRHGGG